MSFDNAVMTSIASEALKQSLRVFGGPAYDLVEAILKSAKNANVEVAQEGNISDVAADTERIDNEMQRLEAQAKVAQEMAIAIRIQMAAEVQIEEFYEYGGEGKLGAGIDEKGLNIGASGSGRKVTKRIYRFIGALAEPSDLETAKSTSSQRGKKSPTK